MKKIKLILKFYSLKKNYFIFVILSLMYCKKSLEVMGNHTASNESQCSSLEKSYNSMLFMD